MPWAILIFTDWQLLDFFLNVQSQAVNLSICKMCDLPAKIASLKITQYYSSTVWFQIAEIIEDYESEMDTSLDVSEAFCLTYSILILIFKMPFF